MADKNKPFTCINIKSYVPLILDLNELNYDAWRELFLTHCRAYGVHGFLDDTHKPKDATDTDWDNLDNLVKSWLYGTMTQSLLTMILKPKSTANSIWEAIESLFRDNKHSRAIELDNELRTLVQGDRSITEYCQKIKAISDLLANIDALVPEKTLVSYLLNGLNSKFESVSMLICHKDPPLSFLEARSTLVSEEFHVNRNRTPTPSPHYDHGSSPTVLVTNNNKSDTRRSQHNRSSSNRRNSDSSNRRSSPSSLSQVHATSRYPPPAPWNPYYYHWAAYGWPAPPPWAVPRPHLAPQPQQHRRQPPANGILGRHPSAQPDSSTSQGAFHATTTDQSSLPPHWQWFPPMPPDQPTDLPAAYNTMTLTEPADANWYMDTGATSHLASNAGILSSLSNKCTHNSVFVGNESTIPVTQTGHKVIHSTNRPLHLNNVLVTPDIIKNLISVCKFTTDNLAAIEFDPYGFSVKDFPTKQILLRCDSTGDLYPVTPSAVALLTNQASLWHQRLGHPGPRVLQSLISSHFISCNKNNVSFSCNACRLGKHSRLPFVSSNNHAT
uniref:GAG-pre-integrase domain-containing protein n=1 Tax=Lactuca sativa TaxID=4236 RepID=A0A9R1WAP4_LACSA|nr:hypothetical protein LSAT_V11C200051950 [Lactuca sativa]